MRVQPSGLTEPAEAPRRARSYPPPALMTPSLPSPRTVLVPILLCAAASASAQDASPDPAPSPDDVAPMEEVIAAIIDEGKNNSEVWETLTYISEEIGPRLTGSSALERANVWSRDRFTELGLTGARLQRWGEVPVRFDRGPSSVKMVGPVEREYEQVFVQDRRRASPAKMVAHKIVTRPKHFVSFGIEADCAGRAPRQVHAPRLNDRRR